MFWKWLGSDQRVLEALQQSTGYDAAPRFIQAPANTDDLRIEHKPKEHAEHCYIEYCYILPEQKKSGF